MGLLGRLCPLMLQELHPPSCERYLCLLVFDHHIGKSTYHPQGDVPRLCDTFQIKSGKVMEEAEQSCGKALPALCPSPSSKMGCFQHKLKQNSRSGYSWYLFSQWVINHWFYYHLMRFLSLAARSFTSQAHARLLPKAGAPGWTQSHRDRHGDRHPAGSWCRCRGEGASA